MENDFPTLAAFSNVLTVASLPDDGRRVRLALEEEADKVAVASFLGVEAVSMLAGFCHVTRHRDLVRVVGDVSASLTRQCVATLEPLEENLSETFDVAYTTIVPTDFSEEVQADLDAPEPLETGELDIAHVLMEQVVLAMSAHPRREDAETLADPGAGAKISPFDVLASLKDST